jgi:multiple sugar transport system permease protein
MRKRRMPAAWREALAFYAFLSPWIVGMIVFLAVPLVATVLLSFTNWDLFQSPQWIGLHNYSELLFGKSTEFWLALRNTVYYAFILVPLNLALSLGIAMLLNQPIILRRWFRTAFYLPSTIPVVAVVMLWSWLLAPSGLVNEVLSWFGIHGPAWLVDPGSVKNGLIIMGAWGLGGGVVLFLAGLQNVPRYLYEAAMLDGAGSFRRFRSITLPMLSPIILFNLISGIIASLQVFTQVYVISENAQNPGDLMLVPYLYNNAFQYQQMGFASAIAWLFFVMVIALTLIILKFARRWVYYESEAR